MSESDPERTVTSWWGAATRRQPPPRHGGRFRRLMARRLIRITVIAAVSLIVILTALTPLINSQLTRIVTQRIAAQMAAPGSAAQPKIRLGGGWLLPQLLTGKLSEIRLNLPDASMGGVSHANIAVTMRGVSQSGSGAHADAIRVATRLPFASLPQQPGQPKASFARASDGSLQVTTVSDPKLAGNMITKVFLKLELAGTTLTAVPQKMTLFGKMLPAWKIRPVTGPPHVTHLPALPGGMAYRSFTPESDGLHVGLGGITTTPLSALPTSFSGMTVSYTSQNHLLGITASIPVIGIPLTIWVQPTLHAGTLTMVPRSVQVLGENRPPSDPLAKLVLSQIPSSQLSRKLPALPAGVNYQSIGVDSAGMHVGVGGVTVEPFSTMAPATPGTTLSGQNGLLVTTVKGAPANAKPMSIVMFARPKIADGAFVIQPQRFIILDTVFTAADVMSQIKFPSTSHPLPPLPAGMTYTGITVQPTGLLITITGTNVTVSKSMFGASPGNPA
jgi:LmeA-like phospholipid-binding